MGAGLFNLVIGGIMVAASLSGKAVFIGTDSTQLLTAAGGVMMAIGTSRWRLFGLVMTEASIFLNTEE